MPPQFNLPRVLRFGTFEVDVPAGELRKNGIKMKLQDQPYQVLCMLLEHPGQVVAREDLRNTLWPADTFVDFDHGLNAAVKRLRDALGDSAESPRFVETLSRRGYRFIAPVNAEAISSSSVFPLTRALKATRTTYLVALAGAVLLILILIGGLKGVGGHRWRLGLGTEPIESLAVLPLENLSHDPEQEYFSDGMTDLLIADLSRIGTLRVTSHTSSMRYKKVSKSLFEIGRELNVDGVVEGSIMRSGNRVRITVELIQVSTDRHLWAETYERDLGDVLKLQGDVAEAVAQQVRVQVGPEQRARFRSAPLVNPKAYDDYLKGRYAELAGTQAGLRQAESYFEESIREDPHFALAYAGLADCYVDLGDYRWLSPKDSYRQANAAVQKALELDPELSEAHSTVGMLNWHYTWDWQTAERELRSAVALDNNYVEGHQSLAWYLAWSGRPGEAGAEFAKMRTLDPSFPTLPIDESSVYYHQRDYKSLVEASHKSMVANPGAWTAHYFLAVGFEGSGYPAQAIPEYQQAIELSQGDSDTEAGLAYVYATTGRRTDAQKILSEFQRKSKDNYVSPYMIAVMCAGLGQNDRAFGFLEQAYEERSFDLPYFMRVDLRMDSLRSDPRFQNLLRRVGLSQ